jgi:hypothetical protein
MKAKQMLRCAMIWCVYAPHAHASEELFNSDYVIQESFSLDFLDDIDYEPQYRMTDIKITAPVWHERIKSYLATLWINYRKWVS